MGEVNTITVDVRPGDTLESIAQKYGVTVDALEAHDPATIGRWLTSDDFRPLQIQVPQAPSGQTLEVMRDNSGQPTHVVTVSSNEANRDEPESSQPDTTLSQDTTVTNPTQSLQSTQSLASVVRRVNNVINQQIEQAAAQTEAQFEEQYIESVPALWSMESRDDLLRYFWVKQGNSLDSYNQNAAQQLVIESSWQYAHELGTQLDNFSELTPDQQQYLTMLQSINPPPLYETGRETLLAHYQSEYAQLFSEQGMDTFFQMFSDSQGIAEGGAFISPEFWQFAEAYQYVSALEDGATLPFTPTFDPDFATRTLLATKGWTFGFGEQGMEDVLIAQELMYMLGESLARQETEGVTFYSDVSTDYMPALYAMLSQQYGADFTADDMVQFVNNLSVVLQNDNIPGDARLSLQETQMYSDLYLTGREMDEDRQLAQGWDTVQQQETQDLLSKLEANVGKIQALDGEILGVSTSGVKGAFANLLKTSSDYVDHLKNIKTQMPGMEDNLVSIQEATEAEKEMMDQIMTMALLLPVGLASETADTGISLLEFLATGDPLAGLGILPILPNQSDEIIDYARDARLLGALDGILPYMDEVSDVTRYGYDSADEILESLEFYRQAFRQYGDIPIQQSNNLYLPGGWLPNGWTNEQVTPLMIQQMFPQHCNIACGLQTALDDGATITYYQFNQERLRIQRQTGSARAIDPASTVVIRDTLNTLTEQTGVTYDALKFRLERGGEVVRFTGASTVATEFSQQGQWIAVIGVDLDSTIQTHAIIVDKIEDGVVYIRDPFGPGRPPFNLTTNRLGVSGEITLDEFLNLWQGGAYGGIVPENYVNPLVSNLGVKVED